MSDTKSVFEYRDTAEVRDKVAEERKRLLHRDGRPRDGNKQKVILLLCVSFIPNSSWEIGGTLYTGPSPNFTCNYNYLNPIRSSSVLFEMSQEGNPYLNVDLFGYVNNSPLRLDPGSNLDGMFFGGPQYSPQMNNAVRVGNNVYIQANFGLQNPDGASYGWDAPGYGFLEVSANGTLISNQNVFKPFNNTSSTLQSLSYSFTVQANTNYYIKAYSLVTYTYDNCVGTNIIGPCSDCNQNT